MQKRHYIFVFIALLLPLQLYAVVDADNDFLVTLDIHDFGLYKLLEKSAPSFNAEVTAGYDRIIQTQLIQTTTAVPLKKGQVFGFSYRIEDSMADSEWIPVIIKITHPKTKNYLGHYSTGFTKKSFARLKSDNLYHNAVFYVFSEDYEMVAGDWVLSVSYQGDKVLSKTFTVVGSATAVSNVADQDHTAALYFGPISQ